MTAVRLQVFLAHAGRRVLHRRVEEVDVVSAVGRDDLVLRREREPGHVHGIESRIRVDDFLNGIFLNAGALRSFLKADVSKKEKTNEQLGGREGGREGGGKTLTVDLTS